MSPIICLHFSFLPFDKVFDKKNCHILRFEIFTRAYGFHQKKSQSQNSIQHFEFSRTFFSSGSGAIDARRAEQQAYLCKKVCENSKCSIVFDFETFSPEIHALKAFDLKLVGTPCGRSNTVIVTCRLEQKRQTYFMNENDLMKAQRSVGKHQKEM